MPEIIIITIYMSHRFCHSCPASSQACRGAARELEEERGEGHQRAPQLWEAPHHRQPDLRGHRGVRL